MLYYSEVTKQNYKTVEELEAAEKAAKTKRSSTKTAPETETTNTSSTVNRRAELARAVEAADVALADAKTKLKAAEEEVETISKAYLKQVEDVLTPARQRVSEAEHAKYKAIQAFNAEYGPYVKTVTSNDAVRDLVDSLFSLDRFAHSPLRWF